MAIIQSNDAFVQDDHARKTYSGTRDTSVTETLSRKGAPVQTRARADLEPQGAAPQPKADRFYQNDGIRAPKAPAPRAGFNDTPSGRPVPALQDQLKLLSACSTLPSMAYLNVQSVDDLMAIRLDTVPDMIPLQLSQPQWQPALDNSFDNTTAATHGATGGDGRYENAAMGAINANGQGHVSSQEVAAVGSQIERHSAQASQTSEDVRNLQAVMGSAIEARRASQKPDTPQAPAKTLFQRSMEVPKSPERK